MLTDTHAHLYWDSFKEDLDSVLKNSIESGVTTIINVGTDLETSQQAIEQVIKLDQTVSLTSYSTIGLHPHEAIKYVSRTDESIHNDIDRLEDIYAGNTKKVVAVGECGLDYNFIPEHLPSSLSLQEIKELQKKLLKAQVDLAKKLDLPLVIHCRDAWDDIWEFASNWRGILHCYSGDLETAQKAIKNNFLISFAATLTYPKNETLREVAKTIPLEKMVLETDCPFLPPQSKRGQRNEPANVLEIAQLIADLKGITLEEVAKQTSANAEQSFALLKPI